MSWLTDRTAHGEIHYYFLKFARRAPRGRGVLIGGDGMNAARPAEILRQLEQTGAPDRDLLARFVASRDSAAFAELVRRHGPLVLGVCRRVTGQAQDAEDAFQATFLVLAKKAGALRNPELLGNYLYGVAFRVASRARRSALRRGKREVLVSALPDPQAPSPQSAMPELQPILDEELAAMPACYRDAIVLCDLRGQSREAAAAALGVPEGTLSSRLANGRKKLAARLTRRGVTLSAALLPVVMQEAQAQVVSNELIAKTCGLVANWAGGGAVPTPLARLAEGGFTVRKMLVFGVLMVASVAGAVFAATPRDETPPDPPKPAVVAVKADAPQPKGEASAVAYTNSPKLRQTRDMNLDSTVTMLWNTTGTHLAIRGTDRRNTREKDYDQVDLVNVEGPGPWIRKSLRASEGVISVTPDGQGLVTDLREYHLISGRHQLHFNGAKIEVGRVNYLQPERKVDLDLPATYGYAFAADEKTFRTVSLDPQRKKRSFGKIVVTSVDAVNGKTLKTLLTLAGDNDVYYRSAALSPDGTRLGLIDYQYWLTVHDVDTGKCLWTKSLSDLIDKPAESLTLAFSPASHRLVVYAEKVLPVVFDVASGNSMPRLEHGNYLSPTLAAMSHDGRLLALTGSRHAMYYAPDVRKVNDGMKDGMRMRMNATLEPAGKFLYVWDTQTGKALKQWDRDACVAFHPTKPLLAVLEPNGESHTRLGFWDFAAEAAK